MTQKFVTLPREVVEQVRGALAYVGAGNSSENPNLAQSTCRQAIWKLDHALRAELEQPDHSEQNLNMIPAGWKLVPDEPNCSMVLAGERSLGQHDFLRLDSAYRAMLAAAPQPPAVEQPQIDWQDMHLKEKRRAEMWIAKYEKDIGKLQVAVPVAARPPSVAARTCANCLHNKPPFGNCDGCSQQNDDADDEGNWEPIPEPQVQQDPSPVAKIIGMDEEYGPMLLWHRAWADFPVGTKIYTHSQPKRPPLTDEEIDKIAESMPGGLEGFLKGWGWRQFARAVIEATHNIK